MKYMTGNELREAYLQFFAEKKDHLRLSSYSLVPENDPTLLLIGAGMAPLKPFFTGKMKPPHNRIVPVSAVYGPAISRMSGVPHVIRPSSRCLETSPSATTSRKKRFHGRGNF